jgi:hypothetical protein
MPIVVFATCGLSKREVWYQGFKTRLGNGYVLLLVCVALSSAVDVFRLTDIMPKD